MFESSTALCARLGSALSCMNVVTVIAWYTQVPVTLTINWDCAHDVHGGGLWEDISP